MKKTILVTGAAGFIGSHLCEALIKKEFNVVGMDNFDPFYDTQLKKYNISQIQKTCKDNPGEFEFFESDIRDIPEAITKINFDGVIHLAAKAGVRPSIEQPLEYASTNVEGTISILNFCVNKNIKNIVVASSSSIYGNDSELPFTEDTPANMPISPYAASKKATEMYSYTYSDLYDLKIAALRFFTVYGPRQRPDLAINKFSNLILEDQEITLFGDGTTTRDYTFIDDIVDGIVGSMDWAFKQKTKCFEAFNLGGGHNVRLSELVNLIENSCGKKAKIKYETSQKGDVNHTFSNTDKAKNYFGYSPKVKIENGVQKYIDWLIEFKG